METAFWLIRTAIMHYIRGQPGVVALYPYNMDTRTKAHNSLIELGKLYESLRSVRHIPHVLCFSLPSCGILCPEDMGACAIKQRSTYSNAETLIVNLQMLQRGVPLSMCKPSLHYMACRAFKQETAVGPLANFNEMWLEQRVGVEKGVTRGKVTNAPERTVAEKRAMKETLAAASATGKIRPVEEWPNSLKHRYI
jgi:hypothetical protein